MRLRRLVCVLFGTAVLPPTSWAQRTGDQARLIFTLSAGVIAGKDLWSVGAQPIQPTNPADTLALGRKIRSTLSIGFSGTYFPGEHFGVEMDGLLIGLGFEDTCRQTFSAGPSNTAAACQNIQGKEKAATAVVLAAGPVFRFNSQSLVSPYARGSIGLIFSNQSSLRTIGDFSPSGSITVYSDDHESRVDPAFLLGVGFTAAVARGYQIRWEVRDNIVGVNRITGPTSQANTVPPHKVDYKHLLSMTIGFDVVLERRRGRRY